MANPTLEANGTQAATVTTEHKVYDPNPGVVGTFVFRVSRKNMVAGDVLEVRAYQMPLTAGIAYLKEGYPQIYYGAPLDTTNYDVVELDPVGNTLTDQHAIIFSIKQTFGTSCNFDWTVEKYT